MQRPAVLLHIHVQVFMETIFRLKPFTDVSLQLRRSVE